jgi:hypothetical protein
MRAIRHPSPLPPGLSGIRSAGSPLPPGPSGIRYTGSPLPPDPVVATSEFSQPFTERQASGPHDEARGSGG